MTFMDNYHNLSHIHVTVFVFLYFFIRCALYSRVIHDYIIAKRQRMLPVQFVTLYKSYKPKTKPP